MYLVFIYSEAVIQSSDNLIGFTLHSCKYRLQKKKELNRIQVGVARYLGVRRYWQQCLTPVCACHYKGTLVLSQIAW